jgi:hypothetical protein
VVAMDGSLGSRAAARRPSRPAQAPPASPLSRIPISVITLIVAIGVFVSCAGYAAGRAGDGPNTGSGIALYWFGQIMIVVPIAGRLLSRRPLSNGAIVTLISVLTIAEYILKCTYDPLGFAFNDEFLHWRGTTNMLQSGQLFELNYGLPIGTHYPGIEEVTSALISATGLSVFEAGLVVAGIAHILYVLFLYLAFVVAIRSHRIAGIAVLLYFAAPSLTSFNSMFIYETLALAFLAMCIVAGLRSAIERSPQIRRRWFIVAVLSIFATVITHHVTSYMLTAFLILVAVASRFTGSRNTAMRFGLLAAISAVTVIGWIALIAPETVSYFSPTVGTFTQAIQGFTSGTGSTAKAPSATSSPLGNLTLQIVTLLLLTVLIAIGSWQAWKRHRRHPWIIGMMIGATLGWAASVGIRVATSDGQEIAGRAATYIYIPVAVIAALALTRLVNSAAMRRWGTAVGAAVVATVSALLINGLANGWPPSWERLPGPHEVASFEASVNPQEVNIGYWSLKELGPGNVIASDQGLYPVLIGYGNQNPQQQVSLFYSTPSWTVQVSGSNGASGLNIQYVETDTRLTTSLPPSGNYFTDQPVVTGKVPLANLTKYNHIEGVARVYDDGTINFYDLVSAGYVPQPKP